MSDGVAPLTMSAWREVCAGVRPAHDGCQVDALMGPRGAVIVDPGTGSWLDAVSDLSSARVALVCTHRRPRPFERRSASRGGRHRGPPP
jgi:hypothetical protein